MLDTEEFSKRLLFLGQYGCHLEAHDGHIWIEPMYMFDITEEQGYCTKLHSILKV